MLTVIMPTTFTDPAKIDSVLVVAILRPEDGLKNH